MPDFFDRRDVSAVAEFSDPLAKFEWPFDAPEQVIFNESADTIYEFSWDGRNVHGRTNPKDSTGAINWTDHLRRVVFVRRLAGSGGQGAKYVQVTASTR